MKFSWIAHRGNTRGPDPQRENMPSYVDDALDAGFEVEIDFWATNNQKFLGHDYAQHLVTDPWLTQRRALLWVHCKNVAAAQEAELLELNWFIHSTETHVRTREGFVWCFPGQPPIGERSVQLWFADSTPPYPLSGISGLCADNLLQFT